jgi:hypothetical protein
MIAPTDAHAIARVLTGQSLDGVADSATPSYRRVVAHLGGLPPGERAIAWRGYLAGRDDAEAIERAVLDADPMAPPPPAAPPARCATLADVRRIMADTTMPWPGWLAAGVLNGLAADPGTGKTILVTDLARRLWHRLPWPDGQDNPFPQGTKTLWVAGDRHFPQLVELAGRFGLPDEAMLFNAVPEDPTGGLDLDDPAEREALAARIRAEAPGLVVIDTVGMTTERNLCRPEDARAYFGPLMDLAQQTGTVFLALAHLSKDGDALGRRIVGVCRVMVKLAHPDPEGQPDRRRVFVDKSYVEKPGALGMTITTAGCEFDDKPPVAPAPSAGGRPPVKIDEACAFLVEELAKRDRKVVDLVKDWEGRKESKSTLFRALEQLELAGRVVVDKAAKPKTAHLVRPAAEAESEPDAGGFDSPAEHVGSEAQIYPIR